jgi:hypothetical protein
MTTAAIALALLLSSATLGLAQTSPGAGGGTNLPPAASPGQAPSDRTAPATSTPTNPGPGARSSSGTVGQSHGSTRLADPNTDPIVQESEREVSRRIKSICKGC